MKKFPLVNGRLFSGSIEIPNFTPEIKNLLPDEASSGFNWAGGMHYTSIENIHKVIDPLFLEELRGELDTVKNLNATTRKICSPSKINSRR